MRSPLLQSKGYMSAWAKFSLVPAVPLHPTSEPAVPRFQAILGDWPALSASISRARLFFRFGSLLVWFSFCLGRIRAAQVVVLLD
jgi:predicted metal-binding membrane protein